MSEENKTPDPNPKNVPDNATAKPTPQKINESLINKADWSTFNKQDQNIRKGIDFEAKPAAPKPSESTKTDGAQSQSNTTDQ